MLVSLTGNLEKGITASEIIPPAEEAALISAVEEGVELISNTQVEAGLEAAGADEAVIDEMSTIYGYSRTNAFKAGVSFLVFLAFAGLILTAGLPNTKLIGNDDEEDDASEEESAEQTEQM